ncbi:lipid IV(A) 3-deoxy-D-manno-octulosonic acid transferase [Crenothrix sp.]|uniref:lipid IV(A) 3-deoxy-D-manno-octulosonic acid transferase n=1 Tax=Crenothrix sp. TaxID=3100433 RepID=UPI00374D79DF
MAIAQYFTRILYSSLFYVMIPFVLCRLLWRSIKAPAYRQRWHERFALYRAIYPQDVIWFHAVSVGEAETLFPLVTTIQQKYPNTKIVVTTTTPTGSARVKAVLKDTVTHVYLPYDIPGAVNRFMVCFKPKLAVIMETEIWPNLFFSCATNNIPLYMINARLSERSTRGYQKLSVLIKPALAHVTIFAQSQQDNDRFIAIGVNPQHVKTVGNMKFDLNSSSDNREQGLAIKAQLFKNRFVWLIASTHEGEEDIFLAIYKKIKPTIPELLLLIVPRHPERFLNVKKLCDYQQLKVATRTHKDSIDKNTDVYLLDTLGELRTFYGVADVAFVGGSMVPVGGHNILEAAAVGVPVMFGPFMANFKAIAESVLALDAAIQCQDNNALIKTIMTLYQHPDYRHSLAAKGKAFVENNKGVCAKIIEMLPLS